MYKGGAMILDNPNITGTSFTPSTPLLINENYTWYIGAEGTFANAGPVSWNPTGTNFMLSGLTAPSPVGPSGPLLAGTGYDTPTFSWGPVAGAGQYYIYVANAAAPTVAIYFSAAGNGTTFTPSAAFLSPGKSYVWGVGSAGAIGAFFAPETGPITWGGSLSFTLASLEVPTPIGPSGTVSAGTIGTTPTFSWNPVTGAVQYRLIVMDVTTATPVTVVDNSQITTSAFTITTPLVPGHRYKWFVGAEGAIGPTGAIAWSGEVDFLLTQ